MESAALPDGARSGGASGAGDPGRGLGGVALRNELTKMVRRPATMVTAGFLLLVNGLHFGQQWWAARGEPARTFALPDAWPGILLGNAQATAIFGSVLLILLVAGEFSWRTARQNIIDGLSKAAWYRGKVGLLVVLALLLLLLQAGTGAAFAAAGTDPLTLGALLPGRWELSAIGGFLLGFLGYGSLALAAALAVRGTGASLGVWFLYVALVERLLRAGLDRLGGAAADAARYLPVSVFEQLFSHVQHDPAALGRAVSRAAAAGRAPPEAWSWAVLLPAAVGWIALLLLVSGLVFRHRDL